MTTPAPVATKRTLKRVAPLSVGKILALIYAALGLLLIPVFLLGIFASASLPAGQRGIFAFFGIGMALCAPILYGLMGFIFGVISAALYNLFAGWVGGIQVEVE